MPRDHRALICRATHTRRFDRDLSFEWVGLHERFAIIDSVIIMIGAIGFFAFLCALALVAGGKVDIQTAVNFARENDELSRVLRRAERDTALEEPGTP